MSDRTTPDSSLGISQRLRVGRNVAANVIGQAWVTLMMIAFVPVLIRHLGLEAYGIIGLFITFQAIMAILDAGMGPTMNREMARFTAGAVEAQYIRDLLRTLEVLAGSLALLLAAAMVLFSLPLSNSWLNAHTLTQEEIRSALVLMGFALACRFLESIYRAALLGLQLQVWYNGANVLLMTFRHAGAAALVAFTVSGLQGFFAWHFAASALGIIVLRWKLSLILPRTERKAQFSKEVLKGIKNFAIGMLVVAILAVATTQADKLLLSRLLPLEAYGIYMLAFSVVSLLAVVAASVTQAFLPVLVEQVSRQEQLAIQDTFHLAAQLVAVMVVPLGVLLVAFPRDLLFLWSGDAALAEAAAPIVRLLAAGSTLHALLTVPYFLMVAHGWTRLAIATNIVAVSIQLPAVLLAVPVFGMEAAAVIWILLNLGYLLFQIPLVHRRLLTSDLARWYVKDVATPVATAAVLALLFASVRAHLDLSRLSLFPFVALAWAIMVSAISIFASRRLRLYLSEFSRGPVSR